MNPGDHEVSKGIVVNPHRCGGTPTVKGTRISASMLARMMSGPKPIDPHKIVEEYDPLTFADLSNVKGWARKKGLMP